jgi:hypothetical protein
VLTDVLGRGRARFVRCLLYLSRALSLFLSL